MGRAVRGRCSGIVGFAEWKRRREAVAEVPYDDDGLGEASPTKNIT